MYPGVPEHTGLFLCIAERKFLLQVYHCLLAHTKHEERTRLINLSKESIILPIMAVPNAGLAWRQHLTKCNVSAPWPTVSNASPGQSLSTLKRRCSRTPLASPFGPTPYSAHAIRGKALQRLPSCTSKS